MIDALHTKLPAEFAEYYVISVSGLPIFSGEGGDTESAKAADTYEALRVITVLQAHGKDVIHPGLIRPDKAGADTAVWLLQTIR